MPLDQHLKNKLFPQILFWSTAQVLGRTKAFCCESILTIEHADGSVINAYFSTDGKQIVATSNDNTTKIYDLIDNKEWQENQEKTIIEHGVISVSLCSSVDGKFSVTAPNDKTAKIRELIGGEWQEKATIKHDGYVYRACFSDDGKHVVTVSK